jgi:hypothetical protein
VYLQLVAKQRLGKNVIAATNIHATREKNVRRVFLYAVRAVSMKVGDELFKDLIVFYYQPIVIPFLSGRGAHTFIVSPIQEDKFCDIQ